jgi:hypothetical protein
MKPGDRHTAKNTAHLVHVGGESTGLPPIAVG